MATMPMYRQQVIPGNTGVQPRASAGSAGAGLAALGQGLQEVAQAKDQSDRAFIQKQDEDARAWTSSALAGDHVKWLTRQKELEEQAAPGAPDFTKNFLAEFDQYKTEALKSAPNEASKKFYGERLDALKSTLGQGAVGFEARAGVQWRLQQASDARDSISQLAVMDPQQAMVALAEQDAILERGGNSAVAQELRAKLKEQVTKAGALGMVERDPAAALVLLNKRIGTGGKPGEMTGDTFIDSLDAGTLVSYQNRAQSYVSQAANKAEAENDKRLKIAKDAIEDLRTFSLSGSMPSPEYQAQVMKLTQGTDYAPIAGELLKRSSEGSAFGSMTQTKQAATLRSMEANASTAGTDPETAKRLEQARGIYEKQGRDYKENPWAAATKYARVPEVQTQPITAAGQAAQLVAARLPQQITVEQYAGRSVSPLQPAEAESFVNHLSKLPPEAKAEELGTVGAQLDRGRILALSEQLDGKSRPLALSLKMGADRTTAGRFASALVLRGEQAINDKTIKKDDSVLSGWRAEISRMVRGTLGDARAEQDIIDAAYYVRAAMDADSSISPGFDLVRSNEQAIKLTIGQPVERGGVKTLLPRGMTEDQFDDKLEAYTPDALKSLAPAGQVYVRGKPVSLEAFSSGLTDYGLRRDSQGRFIPVSNGAMVTTDAEGTQPLAIPIKP